MEAKRSPGQARNGEKNNRRKYDYGEGCSQSCTLILMPHAVDQLSDTQPTHTHTYAAHTRQGKGVNGAWL